MTMMSVNKQLINKYACHIMLHEGRFIFKIRRNKSKVTVIDRGTCFYHYKYCQDVDGWTNCSDRFLRTVGISDRFIRTVGISCFEQW